jgi:hypothetical protein
MPVEIENVIWAGFRMPVVCRFKFPEGLDRQAIEAQFALAIVAAECAFGQARVRISGAYCISGPDVSVDGHKGIQVAIDASTEVGEHIAQVFTGLMIRQLGEDKFTVDRVTRKEPGKELHTDERC